MVGSDNRTRTSAATPGGDAKTLDRRRITPEPGEARAMPARQADRWVEERRANRAAQPAPRLPAFVAI